MELQASSFLE